MVNLTLEDQKQLITLLKDLPELATERSRQQILALAGLKQLVSRIDLSGAPFVAVSEIVNYLSNYGRLTYDHEALGLFLSTLKSFVGVQQQVFLDMLLTKYDMMTPISALPATDKRQGREATIDLTEYLPSRSNSSTNLEFSNQPQFSRQQENLSIFSTPSPSTESLEEQQDIKLVVPVPSLPGTQAFEFPVVMVDVQGKEISRRRGQAHYLTEDLGNGVTLEMVYIPGGTFLMGSPESEGKRYSNERPQHSVAVKPFLISKYAITKAQWKEVASLTEVRQELKLRPSRSGGNSHPVTQVSWHDAVEFCDRLSQKTGHEYRLPTEAEWEYACRAGTTTPFHFGETITSTLANYDARESYRSKPQGSEATTTPVGSFQVANPFGLFDMHGNVWEWCLDQWHENYDNAPTTGDVWLYSSENQNRVMRGGSLLNDPSMCRSSSRLYKNASETFKHVGFRIVFSV
jgi:formylglycine-generating enzyme required for sulfatase activity